MDLEPVGCYNNCSDHKNSPGCELVLFISGSNNEGGLWWGYLLSSQHLGSYRSHPYWVRMTPCLWPLASWFPRLRSLVILAPASFSYISNVLSYAYRQRLEVETTSTERKKESSKFKTLWLGEQRRGWRSRVGPENPTSAWQGSYCHNKLLSRHRGQINIWHRDS